VSLRGLSPGKSMELAAVLSYGWDEDLQGQGGRNEALGGSGATLLSGDLTGLPMPPRASVSPQSDCNRDYKRDKLSL
jgi:hypothetical protein